MSSNSTTMRKRGKWISESEAAGGDRISSLPDELIHKIMSFMNTKFAVQTCVLSRRWESLWKSLPYLNFQSETFPFKGNSVEVIISFNNFITQVLFRRQNTNLVQVRVKPFNTKELKDKCASMVVVEGLFAYAIDHNVQQLTVEKDYIWDFVMPKNFYTCKSLTTLRLLNSGGDTSPPKLPKFLTLSALKYLHLRGYSMTQKYFNPVDFSSACPNLKTLKLTHINFEEDKTFFIKAPNLKKLELSWCNGCKVVIVSPGLRTLKYRILSTSNPLLFSFDDLGSIENAYFNMYNNLNPYEYKGNEKDVLQCINTIKKFRHAKSLTLSSGVVKALSMFPSLLNENRLPFSNLKYLKIRLGTHERRDEVDIPECVLNFFVRRGLDNKTKVAVPVDHMCN